MIITIARQCGSGGLKIGKELASDLDWNSMTERSLKKKPKNLESLTKTKNFPGKAVNSLLYSIAVSYGESNPMEKIF